jgi:hypothetical protein
MKSPVPFLKPKSYYASPFKALVTKDEIVVQRNPIQHIIEDIVVPEEQVIVNEPATVEEPATVDEPLVKNTPLIEIEQPLEIIVEQPKLKKYKHNKLSEPEL